MQDTPQVRRFRPPHAGWLLVIGLLVMLVAIGSIVEVRRQRTESLAERVRSLGGTAILEPGGPAWLRRLVGESPLTSLSRLTRVELTDSQAADSDLRELARHKDLEIVYLFGTSQVTPAGIAEFQRARPDLIFIRSGSAFMGIGGAGDPLGLAVHVVLPDSPAAAVGISAGDIIADFDGQPIPDMHTLVRRVAAHQPGDTVPITLVRHRGTETRTITLGGWK